MVSAHKEERMRVHGVLTHIKGELEKTEENNIWNHPQGEINRNWMSPKDVLALLCFKILKRTWLMRGFVWFCCSFQVWTWNFARGLFQSFHVIWNHYIPIIKHNIAQPWHSAPCKWSQLLSWRKIQRPICIRWSTAALWPRWRDKNIQKLLCFFGFHAARESSSVVFLSARTSIYD